VRSAPGDPRIPRARGADRGRRRPRPHRFRRQHPSRDRRRGGRIESRSRIYGGRDWVRLGAVELGLDCLRRYLQSLPVTERTDFERV